jgi:hypothetical protein
MRLLTIILLIICSTTFGQTTQTRDKKQRTLTYYTFGMGPGQYVDTESLYGFKMKWKKCVIKPRHIRHNRRVERKINERLGENWLTNNIIKLEVGYTEDTN